MGPRRQGFAACFRGHSTARARWCGSRGRLQRVRYAPAQRSDKPPRTVAAAAVTFAAPCSARGDVSCNAVSSPTITALEPPPAEEPPEEEDALRAAAPRPATGRAHAKHSTAAIAQRSRAARRGAARRAGPAGWPPMAPHRAAVQGRRRERTVCYNSVFDRVLLIDNCCAEAPPGESHAWGGGRATRRVLETRRCTTRRSVICAGWPQRGAAQL